MRDHHRVPTRARDGLQHHNTRITHNGDDVRVLAYPGDIEREMLFTASTFIGVVRLMVAKLPGQHSRPIDLLHESDPKP